MPDAELRGSVLAWQTLEASDADVLAWPDYLAARARLIEVFAAERAPLTPAECAVVAYCLRAAAARLHALRDEHTTLGAQLQNLRRARHRRQGGGALAAPPTISRFS